MKQIYKSGITYISLLHIYYFAMLDLGTFKENTLYMVGCSPYNRGILTPVSAPEPTWYLKSKVTAII